MRSSGTARSLSPRPAAWLATTAIAVVANYAAGRDDSKRAIAMEKIAAVLDEAMERVRHVIEELCK